MPEVLSRVSAQVAASLAAVLAFSWVYAPDVPARDSGARRAFQKANPCPANGKVVGSCPGWIIDHVKPICAGGLDHPSNMAWQRVEEAKIKDRQERAECHRLRRTNPHPRS